MDNTNYIALSRQMALWKQMDLVSNNMANMNTAGYKGDDAVFTSYLVDTRGGAADIVGNPLYFTMDYASYKDFSEGMIAHTGNKFDVAIQGNAFFSVDTPQGELYTKKGQFTLNSDGAISTIDGFPILSENGTPFFIAPEETQLIITETGEVMTENGSLGRIKMATFADNQLLSKVGDTMFAMKEGNTAEFNTGNYKLVQGSIEKSNVNGVNEMTKLIKVQRAYEYVQQMIDTEHERLSNTIQAYAQLA